MWRKFFLQTVIIFLMLCSIAAAINFAVDPYNVYRSARSVGFNFFTDVAQKHERLFKSIALIERRPSIVVLGNSKADFAVDPKIFGADSYNAAVRNMQPLEMLAFARAALRINPALERLIVAVDYEMFAYDEESMPGFDPEQLSADRITLGNLFRTLLSYDALDASISTVKLNRFYRRDFTSYEPDGKFSEPALYELFTFENSFVHNSNDLRAWTPPAPSMLERKFDAFRELVELCRSSGVELTVMILPVHRYHLESYPPAAYHWWQKKLTSIAPVEDYVSICIDNGIFDDEKNFWDAAHIKAAALEHYICARFQ